MALSLLLHDWERRVGHVHQPEQVHLDHLPEVVGVGVLDAFEQHHARVVDEDVEASERLVGPVDRFGDLLLVGHVRRDDERLAAVGLDAVASPMPDDAPVTSAAFPSTFSVRTMDLGVRASVGRACVSG